MTIFRNALPGFTLWLAVSVSTVSVCAHGAPPIVAEIEPSKRVVVSAEVQGIVDRVSVALGDRVSGEQVLVVFNKEDYLLDVEMANARLQLSQAELKAYKRQYSRLKQLYGAKNVSLSQLEDQQRLYEVSQSEAKVNRLNLKLSEQALEKATIKAPFEGYVSQRFVELGQLVNRGEQVLEVVSIDPVKVVFYLLEMDYLDVAVGDHLSVEAIALNESKYTAIVSNIAPSETGQRPGYRVESIMTNPKGVLKPGFTVRVSLADVAGDGSGQVLPERSDAEVRGGDS